jgi:oligopeptidase B
VSGAYGSVTLPKFYPDLSDFALMDRGFIEVYADVRGGGGVGSQWHIDGSGVHKKNTAHDIIAVAQYLVSEKYTSAGKIHLSGRSGGGLALGMAVNMHPELWGSLSFFVPKLDVLLDLDKDRYQTEWLEVGNPNVKEEFDCMLGWSPYQNVRKQAYPPMWFMIGLNDVNTPPHETFKMVAKLRANRTNAAPIYMSTDLKGSHYRLNYKNMLHPCVFKLAAHYNLL